MPVNTVINMKPKKFPTLFFTEKLRQEVKKGQKGVTRKREKSQKGV
jgi:hypothetical protein